MRICFQNALIRGSDSRVRALLCDFLTSMVAPPHATALVASIVRLTRFPRYWYSIYRELDAVKGLQLFVLCYNRMILSIPLIPRLLRWSAIRSPQSLSGEETRLVYNAFARTIKVLLLYVNSVQGYLSLVMTAVEPSRTAPGICYLNRRILLMY